MSRRLFLTGATGYLGSALAARFARAGYQVHGLTRSIEGARALDSLGVRAVVGDLTEPGGFIGVLKNCDIAVHAAADPADAPARDQAALEAIRAAAEDGRVRTLLYTSGIWDHGAIQDRIVDDSMPADPLPLVRWRAAHHDVALDLAEFEVRVMIFEPGTLYGEHRGMIGHMFKEGRESKVVTVAGDGTQTWTLVHRDDVAEAYALALEHAKHGDRFLLADDTPLTLGQIAEAVARVTGATVRHTPREEVLATAGLYGEALLASMRASSGRARRELGWVPRHTSFLAEIDDLYREWQKGLSAPVA